MWAVTPQGSKREARARLHDAGRSLERSGPDRCHGGDLQRIIVVARSFIQRHIHDRIHTRVPFFRRISRKYGTGNMRLLQS